MQNDRINRILGHVVFGVLLVFAVVWAYARVFYIDSAYQLFDIINTGTFSVNDGRYAMVISQLLPLLCLKLHLPLPVIAVAYSLSFVLLDLKLLYLLVNWISYYHVDLIYLI